MSKYLIPLTFVLLIIVASLTNVVIKSKKDLTNAENLYESITDSLVSYKNKDSLNVSKILVMQSSSEKDFLKIKNLEGSNLILQNMIKNKDKEIKKLNTALLIKSETRIDTLKEYYPISGDTIIFSKSIILDSLRNNWVYAKYGFINGLSFMTLKIQNQYQVTIGEEGGNIFRKGKMYSTVTNMNPYTKTTDMRVYQINNTVPKKIKVNLNLGIGGLYDISHRNFGFGPYAGIGFTYNLF